MDARFSLADRIVIVADVAQLVERPLRKGQVLGSIPSVGSIIVRKSRKYIVKRKRNLKKSWKSLSREDKSDLTRFVQVLGITFLIIFAVYYIGVNGLTHIGGFWSIFTGERGEVRGDTIAPPPPTLAPIAQYSKSKEVNIKGNAEPGAEITLFVNDEEAGKTITEAGGTFSFSKVLLPKEGKNIIDAIATDKSGNQSNKSAKLIVTRDTKKPKLEVAKPSDGQTFSGEDNQIKVKGTTEAGATVRVNNIQAQIRAGGVFETTVVATEPGSIKITVTATDKAGNERKVELTVAYE